MPLARRSARTTCVVDQVAEDRERRGFGAAVCQLDRVAHAEAHAEMIRADDLHYALYYKVCVI